MTGHSAVGVHDDLASRQASVTCRTTDDELSRRVDEDVGVGGVELGTGLCLGGQHRLDDLRTQSVGQPGTSAVRVVLGGDDQVVQADWALAVVADRHLRLAVGAQSRDDALLAHEGQTLRQTMSQMDGQGHEGRGVVAGVAEHEPLVSGTLQVERIDVRVVPTGLKGLVDPRRDVRGLLPDRYRHTTGASVEADI